MDLGEVQGSKECWEVVWVGVGFFFLIMVWMLIGEVFISRRNRNEVILVNVVCLSLESFYAYKFGVDIDNKRNLILF